MPNDTPLIKLCELLAGKPFEELAEEIERDTETP